MITRIRQRLFTLRHTYGNPLGAQRARVLLYLSLALILITVATMIFVQIPDSLGSGNIDIPGLISAIVVIIAAALSYIFIQRGKLNRATWIVLLAITLGALSAILFGNEGLPTVSSSVVIFLTVPVIMSGVLLSRRGLIVISALILLVVALAAAIQTTITQPVTYNPSQFALSDFAIIAISVLIILAILFAFLGTLQRIASESFDVNTQRRWINLLGLELATIGNEADVLSMALGQVRRVFNQRFIELYLANEDGNLANVANNVQRRLLIRSIEANIVAEAARSRILHTTSLRDDASRRTHMAASTSYAAAAPMIVGTQLLGVLDFQGSHPFTQNELDTFQQLADQIAVALHHIRHQIELEMQTLDHEKTIKRLQTQLQDYTRTQSQNVSDVWSGYIAGRGRQAIGYNMDAETVEPVQATDLPGGLMSTLQNGKMEVTTQNGEQIINVPIKFRDTNLGAMSFAVPADRPLNKHQLEVATTVAERLALALENTRLFEQSQSQALRERKASEVATALIGATDVRVVLNMAAEQFKDALGAVNTRIYIQPETLMEPLAQTQQEK